jgi:hypothetical protein
MDGEEKNSDGRGVEGAQARVHSSAELRRRIHTMPPDKNKEDINNRLLTYLTKDGNAANVRVARIAWNDGGSHLYFVLLSASAYQRVETSNALYREEFGANDFADMPVDEARVADVCFIQLPSDGV